MHTNKLVTNTPLQCPCCSTELSGFTGEAHIPAEDDLSVCLYCGTLLVFQGKGMDMKLRELTDTELLQLKEKHPQTWQQLLTYKRTVEALK